MTRGGKLLVAWLDGSTDWIPLKDLKESNPVEVAEYAVAKKFKRNLHLLGGSAMFYAFGIA